jgi:hypothetical protein
MALNTMSIRPAVGDHVVEVAGDRVLVEGVDLRGRRGLAAAGDRLGQLLDASLRPTREEDLGALRRQLGGHRGADLACCPEDDRGLVLQAPCAGCSCHRRHGCSLAGIAEERRC